MSADLPQQPEAEIPQQPSTEVEQPGAENADLAQSEGNESADAKPPESDEGDKKVRRHISHIQRRIDELTRERHDERRAREAAETQLRDMQAQLRNAQGQASMPKLEQFHDYVDFTRAMAKWEAGQEVSARLEEFSRTNLQTYEQRAQQERAQIAAQQFDSALQAVEQDGAKKFSDFAEVVANGPRLGPAIGQMVMTTERPSDISYYLAKNPEHAMAIASMHPMQAAREIGKLEAQFVNKRVTSAPPPPKTVGGSDKAAPSGLSDDLPPGEWYRRREAQLRKKG